MVVVCGMAFEAGIAQAAGIHAVYGLRPSRLMEEAEQAIRKGAKGIMSFGTAAGLSPSLRAGSIIIARQVSWNQRIFTADSAWAAAIKRQLPEAICADIAGVDSPLTDAGDKSLLHQVAGAAAADMESHRAALLARQYNLPFAALRVVLDDAQCALPPAALAAVTPEGHISYGRLLASLLAHPQQLPALLRLSAAHAKAGKALLRCRDILSSQARTGVPGAA